MEKKYIDANLALTAFYECDADIMADYGPEYGAEWGFGRTAIENVLASVPSADVVPVVRCRDCKYYMTIHCTCDGCCISDDWYCADGQRRA